MTEKHAKTIACVQRIKQSSKDIKPEQSTYHFFQSLLYGKRQFHQHYQIKHYNPDSGSLEKCVLYIHENHIEILVCMDLDSPPGKSCFFNLKKIQTSTLNAEYQMEGNVNITDKYLQLKQQEDEFVLTFGSKSLRDKFKVNLMNLKKQLTTVPLSYNSSILKAFIKTDINQNQQISYQQLVNLLKTMNISMNFKMKKFLQKVLKKNKIQQNTIICSHEFQKLWKIFYCREQLIPIFQQYCNQQKFNSYEDYIKPLMNQQSFTEFLKQQQQQVKQQIQRIIYHIFRHKKQKISFYEFSLFILQNDNELMGDYYQKKYLEKHNQEPLNNFYCYSSHNTYLTGNQLTSMSKVERYLQDLQNGIRCVQIDVYDGYNEPIVKHGYTLTSTVTFKEVIMMIKRFTEVDRNHTPIILSLQVHSTAENQKKIAQILREAFNDKILELDINTEKFKKFRECRGKIIIKAPGSFEMYKKGYQNNQMIEIGQNQDDDDSCEDYDMIYQNDKDEQNQSNDKNSEDDTIRSYEEKQKQFIGRIERMTLNKQNYKLKRKEFNKFKSTASNITINEIFNQSNEENNKIASNDRNLLKKNSSKKFNNSSKANSFQGSLLKLTSLLSRSKKQSINKQQTKKCIWQSSSFSERVVQKLFTYKKTTIKDQSSKQWFRSYPGGFRVNSSNFNPLPSLQLGIQIIAMNTQKQDDPYNNLMRSFFLKGTKKYTGYREKQYRNVNSTYIEIQFISALRIYYNQKSQTIPPVYVDAYFIGTQKDSHNNEYFLKKRTCTNIVEDNSFNPIFNEMKMIKLQCIDINFGFLVVEIPNCGRSVVPLDCLRNGYRTIELLDHRLKEKQSKILCKIKVQTVEKK